MPNPFNGSRQGKRGGRNNRPSKQTEPPHHNSQSARIPDEVGVYWDCMDAESEADHLIPRQSLTNRQHLKIFPQKLEFEPRTERQLDRQTGQLVTVTNPRLVWKSDYSLLKPGKPDNFGDDKRGTKFTRVTSKTKRHVVETERQNVSIEYPIDPLDTDQPD